MNPRAEKPASRFVTCRCQFCDLHIEFDANELVEENSLVPCPRCNLETKLFVPPQQNSFVPAAAPPVQPAPSPPTRSPEQIRYLTSIGVANADKLDDPNHPWQHDGATPKQVAYLTYMGVAGADRLAVE